MSGSFGRSDMHFASARAHATTQVLLRLISQLSDGVFSADVIVQDVGLAGGYAERDDIDVDIQPNPPYRAPDAVKCLDVTVGSDAGTSPLNAVDHYGYLAGPPVITSVSPASGPTSGGTRLTITGTNLNGADAFIGNSSNAPGSCIPTQCGADHRAQPASGLHSTVMAALGLPKDYGR